MRTMADGPLQTAQKQHRLGGATGKGWTPGQSGNPRGRPRADYDIARMCREHAPAAVAALVRGLSDPRNYTHAAEVLLNRGFGRPAQSLSIETRHTATQLHLVAAQGTSVLLQELGLAPTPEPSVIDMTAPPPAAE
jgi:hypothetical protein